MSPAAKQTWKQVGLHLAKHGTWGVIAAALLQFFGPPIAEAVAGRIAGVPAQPFDIEAITKDAVTVADEHARALVAGEIAPVRGELRELTRQVDRMAGALEEMNRRRAAP